MTSDATSTFELANSRYGKSRIRVVTVDRGKDGHGVRDLTVDVSLEGDFEAAHTEGDNRRVIATDTMKNTTYVMARERPTGPPELLGIDLARHFAGYPQVDRATISLRQSTWRPIVTGHGPARDAFLRSGDSVRTARVEATGTDVNVEAGVEDLTILKTGKSAFSNFDRDRYTTLADTEDRLMATRATATWGYASDKVAEPGFDFDTAYDMALVRLLDVFAEHFSPSVQASIWVMGTAMLEAVPSIDWVRMVLPNLHHWVVDLGPFGLDNPGQVFLATTEPHGTIDATVRRR
jgi:urate oxidase